MKPPYTDVKDDLTELIEQNAGNTSVSPKEIEAAISRLAELKDEQEANKPRTGDKQNLRVYKLDVVRDESDAGYIKALTDAIVAVTRGDFDILDYKGYAIYYTDAPQVSGISLEDGHAEYRYDICFKCDALMCFYTEEYHSEEEREAFLDPENEAFEKTLGLLNEIIRSLDEGKWLKKKKGVKIYEFKDYSNRERGFKDIEWGDREKDASQTLSFLLEECEMRTRGVEFTEDDFALFADVIRRMVYFADYGKRNYMLELERLVEFIWEPKTKVDHYIKLCMEEFGQFDVPDRLFDNCTIYYFHYDPRGWEALAYILPIMALSGMNGEYEPDDVKSRLLQVFDIIPKVGYRERVEMLIEEDRAKAAKAGGSGDDQEDI